MTRTSLVITRATTTTAPRCSPSTCLHGWTGATLSAAIPAGRLYRQGAGGLCRDHQRSGLQQHHKHAADGFCYQPERRGGSEYCASNRFHGERNSGELVCVKQRNTQITFHFNSSPVTTQGPQTMHIPAGAFNRVSDSMGNFEFNCSFCYAVTPLQVTTTNPPDGGTFSPAAPGDYQYDVNFNQAVDPASVDDERSDPDRQCWRQRDQCSAVNGKHDCPFTVHFNFGGSVTASIGAGAITAVGCNPNAAFTGNYTVEGCPPANHYDIAQIGGSIVPGYDGHGNHGDDQTTTIALPFSYSVTTRPSTASMCRLTAMPSSRLLIRPSSTNVCRGRLTTTPSSRTGTTSAPMQQVLGFPGGLRHFHLGYVALRRTGSSISSGALSTSPASGGANYELRLYEGQTRFDVIYGTWIRATQRHSWSAEERQRL